MSTNPSPEDGAISAEGSPGIWLPLAKEKMLNNILRTNGSGLSG